jgi:hypothetical protein
MYALDCLARGKDFWKPAKGIPAINNLAELRRRHQKAIGMAKLKAMLT